MTTLKENFYVFWKEFIKLNLLNQKTSEKIITYVHQVWCKGFKENSFFNDIKFFLNKKVQEEQLNLYNMYIFKKEEKYTKIIWVTEKWTKYFWIMKNSKEYLQLLWK